MQDKPIIGVDMASGKDHTTGTCPVCKKMQELVSKDYMCKNCVRNKIWYTACGIIMEKEVK